MDSVRSSPHVVYFVVLIGHLNKVDEFAIPTTVLRHFELASSPYSESVVRDITNRRRSYPDQKLFFDRLLAFAELDGQRSASLYQWIG